MQRRNQWWEHFLLHKYHCNFKAAGDNFRNYKVRKGNKEGKKHNWILVYQMLPHIGTMSFAVESTTTLDKLYFFLHYWHNFSFSWDLNAKLLTLIISVDQLMIVCLAVHCTLCRSSVLPHLCVCSPACINSPADCPGSYSDEADALLKDYQSLSSYC